MKQHGSDVIGESDGTIFSDLCSSEVRILPLYPNSKVHEVVSFIRTLSQILS